MLNKAGLVAELLQLFTTMETKTTDAKQELADGFATAIENFVKTGTVAAGIPVTTAGSATAQAGATTAPAPII